MHLCTQTLPFDDPLDEVFEYVHSLGVEGVDLKVNPEVYLDDDAAQAELREQLDDSDLEIDVLSATGVNPLHPVEEEATEADRRIRDTIRLADQLDVDTVSAFSGLPGGSPDDATPNWITAMPPFPELAEAHEYQWTDVAVPYWESLAAFADDHGVDVAIEIHVNTLVHTPPAVVRLREAAGDRIGGYLDPAHLVLQDIDPIEAIRYLAAEEALDHFEASDVKIHAANTRLKGRWDITPMDDPENRSWTFCTVGYGHGEDYWRDLLTTLRVVGYDGPVSVQQLHTPEPLRPGLERAVSLLREAMF